MKKEKNKNLDKWGYPINRDHNFEKPEGNFETGVALVIALILIILGAIYGTQIQL